MTQAEQAADSATLTAPISGTVGAVNLSAGKSASSSSTITIVGQGDAEVTVDAPLSDLPELSAGQTASVAAAGAVGSIQGTVTQIGILPTSSSDSSTTTYPVTVVVPDAPQALADGTSAQVSISTKQVSNVVTVPDSALTMVSSTQATAQVASGSTVKSEVVTVGAVGGGRAQVTSGITAGQQVVLADLSEALPTNQSTNVRGLTTTGGGGFSGGGDFGGGAGGGGGGGGR